MIIYWTITVLTVLYCTVCSANIQVSDSTQDESSPKSLLNLQNPKELMTKSTKHVHKRSASSESDSSESKSKSTNSSKCQCGVEKLHSSGFFRSAHDPESLYDDSYYKDSFEEFDTDEAESYAQTEAEVEFHDDGENRIIGGEITRKNQFPWMVRLYGGCNGAFCTGSLISAKHVLTAYHCLEGRKKNGKKEICDHSDGGRKAVIGRNFFAMKKIHKNGGIPLYEYRFPENAGYHSENHKSHDIAIYILSKPVTFTSTLYPICLPTAGLDYSGEDAVAAGWGDYRRGKHPNSEKLRHVTLKVTKDYLKKKHKQMFTTEVGYHWKKEVYKDPCSGDSGGPLMWTDPNGRMRVIGTVQGSGYNCDKDQYHGDQIWNRVEYHLPWIKKILIEDNAMVCD